MAKTLVVERLSGHQVGGISPFGSRRALPVFAEQRSLEHEPVALNGGGRSIIVELARDGLVRLLEPTIAEPVQAG